MKVPKAAAAAVLGLPLLLAAAGDAPRPPATRRAPVEDRYHGVAVVDDYRWLEDAREPRGGGVDRGAEPARRRAVLDALPGAETLRRRVREIRTIEVPRFGGLKAAGGRLFALRFRPPQQQPVLVVLPSADQPDEARVLVDPNRIDPSGGTSIDWYVPSLDGRRVAVSLAQGGSERGDVHVYDVDSGEAAGRRRLARQLRHGRRQPGLGRPRGGLLLHALPARRRAARGRPRLLRAGLLPPAGHARASDRYEIGKDFPRIAEIELRTRPDGRYVLANVQNGDGGEFEQHLRREDGSWTRLSRFEDRVLEAVFDPDDESLLLLSRAGAPRGRLLRLALRPTGPLGPPQPFLPEGEGVLEASFSWDPTSKIVPTRERLYLVEQLGGPERVRVARPRRQGAGPRAPSRRERRVPGRPRARAGRAPRPERLLRGADGLVPLRARARRGARAASRRRRLSVEFPISLRDATVSREWAVSKDGTRVPLTVIAPKGAPRDGTNPDAADRLRRLRHQPRRRSSTRACGVWLEHGGVFAVANLRGGGEFGEEWHRRGTADEEAERVRRLRRLRRAPGRRPGTPSPQRLAIEGGSNGGLLMGAALTQHPELFAAVVSHVGIYDMLRVELSPNGAFNVTEFGTVKDPDQFRALYAYSPYHHVKDGTTLPAGAVPRPARTTRASTRCTRAR